MSIILLSNKAKGPAKLVSRRTVATVLVSLVLAVPSVSLMVGYSIGVNSVSEQPDLVTSSLKAELVVQREDIAEARQDAQDNLNAMTMRLAELQSRVVRLDALGERLTEIAKLDNGEFDFDNQPAIGGPGKADSVVGEAELDDYLASFDALTQQLEDREQQLGVLESLLMNRGLQDEVHPAGFPAEKGWLSSKFGVRTDPFTGRPARHDGVDIAGKLGSNILVVAAGVVTWSSDRYGYGNMVEINHGNGYVTRYAHNKENLVQVGDAVKKGQVIALMGSSGRSTGPHVHFEVLRNGRVVDPVKYVRAARK
ncbi:M23 family metallopeptidase [Pseudomonadota bacterium]